jgi:hypothetical protein
MPITVTPHIRKGDPSRCVPFQRISVKTTPSAEDDASHSAKKSGTLEDRRPVRQNLLAPAEATVRVQRLLAAIVGREECRDGSRIVTVHGRN